MKYSMFIGRWQPWHDGHQWLIDQRLTEGKNVLICIRDVMPDEKNPYTCEGWDISAYRFGSIRTQKSNEPI